MRVDGVAPGDSRAEVWAGRGQPLTDGWRGTVPEGVPTPPPLAHAPVWCYEHTAVHFRDDVVVDVWGQELERPDGRPAEGPGDSCYDGWTVRPVGPGLSVCRERPYAWKLRAHHPCALRTVTVRDRLRDTLGGMLVGQEWYPQGVDPTRLALVAHLVEAEAKNTWYSLSWTEAALQEMVNRPLGGEGAGQSRSNLLVPSRKRRRAWLLAGAQASLREGRGEGRAEVIALDEATDEEAWQVLQRLNMVGRLGEDLAWEALDTVQRREIIPMAAGGRPTLHLRTAAAVAQTIDADRNPELLVPAEDWDETWVCPWDVARSLAGVERKPFGTRVGLSPSPLSWDFEDGGPGRMLLLATRQTMNLGILPFRDHLTPLQHTWPRLLEEGGGSGDLELMRDLEALYHLRAEEHHLIIKGLLSLAQRAEPPSAVARAVGQAIRRHLEWFDLPLHR